MEIKKSTVRKSSSSIILSKEAKAAKSYITEAPARELVFSGYFKPFCIKIMDQ